MGTVDLQLQIDMAEEICRLIENNEEYMGKLTGYLPVLNETVTNLLSYAQDAKTSFEINESYVLQILNDILYGMEHQDSVFLLDALRYGLIALYDYGKNYLQSGGGEDEQTDL